MSKERMNDEKKINKPKPDLRNKTGKHPSDNEVSNLQQLVGNRAVQKIIQRSGDGPTEIDDEIAGRINQERGSGLELGQRFREQSESAFGYDFSDVRIHTSPEANQLNRELGAKAFTSGKDIFFREDSFDQNSSAGKSLLTHELTHVVQQGTGMVKNSGSSMVVNAPGDALEQQADTISQIPQNSDKSAGVQRQVEEEEEDAIQTQEEEEEIAQMQEEEEEDEIVMAQEEEEEELMP